MVAEDGKEDEEGDIDGCEDVGGGEGAPVGGEVAPHAPHHYWGFQPSSGCQKVFPMPCWNIYFFMARFD